MDCNTNAATINGVSWESMTAIEPGLLDLERSAKRLRKNDWRGWEKIKANAKRFVGWYASKSELRNDQAYGEVLDHLLSTWEVKQ